MYLANGSQNFSRKKNADFFGNSCKGLSKALSRAGSGRDKVMEVIRAFSSYVVKTFLSKFEAAEC